MRRAKSLPATLALALLSVAVAQFALPNRARADWSAWGSGTLGYCWVAADCIAAGSTTPCDRRCFGLGTCERFCSDAVSACFANAFASGGPFWSVTGHGRAVGGGDYKIANPRTVDTDSSSISATGERTSATTFRVHGTSYSQGSGFRELAVLRFTGDPSVFNEAAVSSVDDMIARGFISSGDVLLRKGYGEIPSSFDFTGINVAGLSDDQILVWAAGHGVTPTTVTATSKKVVLALGVVVLVVGAVYTRRRRLART